MPLAYLLPWRPLHGIRKCTVKQLRISIILLDPILTDYLANSNRNRAIDKTRIVTRNPLLNLRRSSTTRPSLLKHSGADAYYNRGYAYMKLKSYEPKVAIADYDRAIGLNPEYASALFLSRQLPTKD